VDKDKLEELKNNYRITFATEQGKKVLEDLESRFHRDATTFSTNVNEMAFLEGQRSVILTIKKIIKESNKK